EARLVDRRGQDPRQLGQLNRLDEEVDGAALDGRHRLFHTAESRHDHGHDLGVAGHGGVEDVETVRVGELQVDDETVVGEPLEAVERVGARGRLRDDESLAGQVLGDDFAQIVVVIDEEDTGLWPTRHANPEREGPRVRRAGIRVSVRYGIAGHYSGPIREHTK